MESDEDLMDDISEKSSSNELLRRFIEAYESLPVLWNSSHEAYRNKTKKNAALDELLEIWEEDEGRCNKSGCT